MPAAVAFVVVEVDHRHGVQVVGVEAQRPFGEVEEAQLLHESVEEAELLCCG